MQQSESVYYLLHSRLQQYMNCELPDVQAGFRKGKGTRDQIANICWIIKKARKFQKISISALLTMPKRLTVWIRADRGKLLFFFNRKSFYFFQELSCFFNDPADVGNLISGSSAFSKSSLNIWKFTVHVLLKPGLENSEHY